MVFINYLRMALLSEGAPMNTVLELPQFLARDMTTGIFARRTPREVSVKAKPEVRRAMAHLVRSIEYIKPLCGVVGSRAQGRQRGKADRRRCLS